MAGRKTVEERIALIDAKIAKKREEIAALETQKHKLQNPVTMKSVMDKAKKATKIKINTITSCKIHVDPIACLISSPTNTKYFSISF